MPEMPGKGNVGQRTEKHGMLGKGNVGQRTVKPSEPGKTSGMRPTEKPEMPGKTFIGPCLECKYMKSNSLEDVRRVLINPEPEDVVEVSPEVREGSLRCIDEMFRYAEAG